MSDQPEPLDADRTGADGQARQLFVDERRNLMAVSYRLLGTVTDAEDVLQDVFERWLQADRSEIENPAAYLTTMTTRASIDRLRSARAKREVYVGPWLPEPIPTGPDPGPFDWSPRPGADPAATAELDESLTIGYLHLLEQLTPMERACYLMHDVFDFSYREVASMVGKEEANCRQLASRARSKLKASRPDQYETPAPDLEDDVCQRLIGAVIGGDVAEVMALMTEDVIHLSDGGADHRAARQPIVGPERVARLLVNLANRFVDAGALDLRLLRVNNQPGVLVLVDRSPVTLVVFEVAKHPKTAPDGLIRRLYAVVNPDKLTAVAAEAE
jgi:RNA polymerase sigma-70 factor (ECF subfamily)